MTAASTLGLTVVVSVPAAAAVGLTVYRLDADWGYPIGPKGKTRCGCRSCYRRAASGYFRTEAAAIAGRVHPCCVCQPYSVTLTDISGDDLFGDGDSADLRDPRVAAVFDGVVPQPAALPVDRRVPSSAATLPVTGSPSRQLTGVGAALVAAGGALLALRQRGDA